MNSILYYFKFSVPTSYTNKVPSFSGKANQKPTSDHALSTRPP